MAFDHRAHVGGLERVGQLLEAHHGRVAAAGEIAGHVQHVGNAARHARGKIAAGRPEHDHATARHVFAAVVADGFDDGVDAAVADAEPFAGHAANVGLAAGGAVERDVAGDDVLLRHERGTFWGIEDDPAAAQALAQVIIGVAFQLERHAARHECPEALPGAASEFDVDGVVGQAFRAPFAGQLTAGDGADDAVDVANGQFGADILAAFEGGLAQIEQRGDIERFLEAVVLFDLAEAPDLRTDGRLIEDVREVESEGSPMGDGFGGLEAVGPPDHFRERAETEFGHDLAQFLGHEPHEIDDVLGVARESLAQLRVLGGHADGAGVQVADAHHDAAEGDQRRGRESELLGAEQGGDGDVAARLELAVGLDVNAAPEIVQHECLVGFGQTEFPGCAGVFDGRERRRAGAAVVAADEDDVGVGFRDAGGDGADADLGDELDADAGAVVRVFEVMDQLGEVFDGVDVVVRRGRDEPDAGRGEAGLGDPGMDFAAR